MYKVNPDFDQQTVAVNAEGFPKVIHLNQFTSQQHLKALHILGHPGVILEEKKEKK
jgi:hypothetical protein